MVGGLIYIHILCIRAAKAVVGLRICTDLPEPSLLDNAISTVNSDIFARILFSRNLRSFVKIKSSPNGETTLSFTDIVLSCTSRDFFSVANMLFNAIRENKPTKISGFAVPKTHSYPNCYIFPDYT